MQQFSESICEDNGLEIVVSYESEMSASQRSECHGEHETGIMVYTELTSVEVVIAGKGVDILAMLNEKQKEKIISKLNYE